MSVKLVLAAASAVALCCAQSDPTPSAGTAPAAKVTGPETTVPQENPTPAAPKPGPQVIENAPPADKTPEAEAPASEKSTVKNAPAPATTRDPKSAPYIFGPLDVVVVNVWNNTQLSRPYEIHQDGKMSVPLIGDVQAAGLTQNQLKEVIAQKLEDGDYLRHPEVTVELGRNNSKHYYVYGEVGRAGPYPLQQATTVMDALSEVGGFRDFAKVTKIRVQRILPGGEVKEYRFNYKEVSHGKNMIQNILLQDGDRIYVD